MPPAVSTCAVVVGTRERLAALRQHVTSSSADIGETLVFTDAEIAEAFDAIARRRPHVIVIDQLFAAASRGALFLAGLKSDSTLEALEITVVSPEGRAVRLSTKAEPHREPLPRSRDTAALATRSTPTPLPVSEPAPQFEVIRRAPRVQLKNTLRIQLDGAPAMPVDLSVIGAQAQSANVMRPGQRVRLTLGDEISTVRLSARVAWASYERAKGNPTPFYRVGMEFTDADPTAIQAFCDRHRQPELQPD